MAYSHVHKAKRRHFNLKNTYLHNKPIAQKVLAPLLLSICMLLVCSCATWSSDQASSHATTRQQHSNAPLTYVAIGASDTFGFGTHDPYSQNWASDLAMKLGPHYHLVNLGIPSITVHDALRLELPVALDAHPSLITIWLAVNDITDSVSVSSYTHDLNTLLASLRAHDPQALIAVANVPNITLLPYFHQPQSPDVHTLQTQISAYNAAIATAATRYHAVLIDLSQQNYNLQQHPDFISQDGLHPTAAGYAQVADVFYLAIQNTLKSRNT
ncbi:MAG TPA: SGNH/GDSL hydrolase family protein [Ktedonobacteraceae bacterium]|nr:SGNH/GDSL hydrolase family protein [Ktedonobacteraceae bacterium]